MLTISKRNQRTLLSAGLPALWLLCSPHAHSATQRDLDSHEHGASTLDVVVDNQQVFVDFQSPWMNLVGFEHQPASEEQLSSMTTALQTLETGASTLLSFNSDANCTLQVATVNSTVKVEIDQAAASNHTGEHDEHADEHKDDHDDEHADEHHDEHADEHKDEHDDEHADGHHDEHADEHHDEHDEVAHSEVTASYEFSCQQPEDLAELSVALFSTWSGISDIDVQLAGPGGQSFVELDSDNTTIDLAPVR